MKTETRSVVVLGSDDKAVLQSALRKLEQAKEAVTIGHDTVKLGLDEVHNLLSTYLENID